MRVAVESDILHQNGDYWVAMDNKGWFVVYQDTITHAEPRAYIGPERDGKYGLNRAIEECNKRATISQ
jgi:hypothetical protein